MKNDIIKLVDACDIVSFDIFDTLILRNISKPINIFKILSKIVLEKFQIKDFYEIRVSCEKEARVDINNFECNIDEIYNLIGKKIKNKKLALEIKKLELELEIDFCVQNPFMKDIYEYCKKKKKHIIFISDMYLDEAFISRILKKCGYVDGTLYVSSTYQKNKGSLELYNYVLEKEKINKEKWVHIGDNTYSDYEAPLKFGIKAYNYTNVSSKCDLIPNSNFEAIVLGIQNNYLYSGKELSYWEYFGVKYVSLIYFGFTKWLYDLTKGEDNLFFLSRDGYIIHKIYDLLNEDNKIFTKYLYCSRKATQVPSLFKRTKDEVISFLTINLHHYFGKPLKEFLNYIDIDVDDVDIGIIKSFSFETFDDIITDKDTLRIKKLLARLYYQIKNKLEKKYEISKQYLQQEISEDFKVINIVDIGWSGSIQEAIINILERDVVGYYFATNGDKKLSHFCDMFGYYFDFGNPRANMSKVLEQVMMYELIFSAPHGGVVGYHLKDDEVIPNLNDDESYNKVVMEFQNSAFDIIKLYVKYVKYFDSLDRDFCVFSYNKFLNDYEYNDVVNFSKLETDYVIGSNKKFKFVNTISDLDKINNEEFYKIANSSLWSGAFLLKNETTSTNSYLEGVRRIKSLKFADKIKKTLEYVKIYFDYGNGFLEEDAVVMSYDIESNNYSFYLDNIPNNVKRVRINLAYGIKLKIYNLMIDSNKGSVKCLIPNKNLVSGKINKCISIYSKKPCIIINTDEQGISWIRFMGKLITDTKENNI